MDFQYTALQQVGQGAYGCVYKAIDNVTKEVVAIKHLRDKSIAKSYNNGTKLAEVVALEALKEHPKVIHLKKVIQQDDDLFYVFEYMPTNLLQMIRSAKAPTESEIQSWVYQILQALAYMHSKGFIHRDLKPENILANEGTLKLADFGLSKKMGLCLHPNTLLAFQSGYCGIEGCTCGCTTTYMCTRWYRAPKLLLGAPSYSTPIDMWSLGVTMAEMFKSQPLFPGTSGKNQLEHICAVLGAPNYHTWKEGCALAKNCNFEFGNTLPMTNLATCIPRASPCALNLIQALLVWNPVERLTALEALKHPFFQANPRSYEKKTTLMSSCQTQEYLPGLFEMRRGAPTVV